ncbi:MAG TPA: response regulator transcription factor [Saprospiraceae bacterium]|nr:response regulator transcription factor [Saprospiraceae bacterium]HMV23542.1 response regulator transcription factor [Saprospiraceae bacterium]HMX84746.1 response regulator transcription factor [Saprospiraceae bacterium]HMZ73634.1 response regulator transcription factor [Saprospiraceae bacterium]HNA42724.1 response regulator transcription factor [Saprospiraceae bacterium]
MAQRILLVEDEESILTTLKLNLEFEGYEVVYATDGKTALDLFKSQYFHLVVLDIMIPILSGLDVCEQIRLTDSETPIIFLTARDTIPNKIDGLKKGADDYLTKPFSFEELLLRIKNLIKRSAHTPPDIADAYTFGENIVNFKTYEAKGVNGTFELTLKEAKLIKLLVERKNEVVSRQQILQAVWGYEVYPSTRTIDNFILSFRKYFEKDQKNPVYFHSIRGVGYKFSEPS